MKRNYLISVIVMVLIVLSLYSTYAMFTETVETDEIINMNASLLPLESKIVEYERLEINSQDKRVIEFTVNNDTNNSLYYGVWYEMVNPNIKNDDIVIGKKEDTQNDTNGQLTQGTSAKVTFVIENKTSSTITVNIGVGYSNDNNLNLPTNRYLITEVYVDKVYASEYIESLLVDNPTTMNNDDPDGNVRYMGANPNNYVSFNNELWRIIGVFNVASTNGGPTDKRIKIIRNESLGIMAWDTGNINNWATASLQIYLNGDYYNNLNKEAKELTEDTYWNLGGSSTYIQTASLFYSSEREITVHSDNPTYWIGKIGLMYPSDYGYATSGGTTTNRETCLAKELYIWPNLSDCYNNDYLYNSRSIQWTITTNSGNSYDVFSVRSTGGYVREIDANATFSASPVLYLKSTVQITGGDGTSKNPFALG